MRKAGDVQGAESPNRARKDGVVKPAGVLAKRRHAIYMRRSYSVWKAMCQRIYSGERIPNRIPATMPEMRRLIMHDIGQPCWYCNKRLTERNFSLDHNIPLSRGGADTENNWQFICVSCNKRKGNFTEEEYRALIDFLCVLDTQYPNSGIKQHVLRALAISNSFAIGSNRRARKVAQNGAAQ